MSNLLDTLDGYETLDFEQEEVIIEGFMERYRVDYNEAKDIFEETKKWLWLASKSGESDEFSLFIDRQLLVIDEMWHNFILHTKHYYRFCLDNFNKIIHHNPTPKREKDRQKDAFDLDPERILTEQERKFKEQYSLIYDHLGPETLLKWYDTMANKYTPEYLNSIKKG